MTGVISELNEFCRTLAILVREAMLAFTVKGENCRGLLLLNLFTGLVPLSAGIGNSSVIRNVVWSMPVCEIASLKLAVKQTDNTLL